MIRSICGLVHRSVRLSKKIVPTMAECGDDMVPTEMGADTRQEYADDEWIPEEMDEDGGYEDEYIAEQPKPRQVSTFPGMVLSYPFALSG